MNDTIMLKEILEQPSKIQECHDYNMAKINELASIIKKFNPQNIVIVGRGTSMHVGIYAKHILELYYHIPVSIASQSIFTVYDSYTDMSKSLVIGISQSGGGKDTLTVIKKARECGALTVSIVNNLESDLTKASEHVLYCNADKAVAYPATKTFVTSLYLITKLAYEITRNDELNISEEKLINVINNTINRNNEIKEKAQLLKENKEIIVLGRGLALSIAMETGLKIKEACQVNINAFPISEFYHGPIAILDRSIPVLLFDIDKEVRNDVLGMINRVNEKNVPLFLISNNNENSTIKLNSEDGIYSFFEAAIVIQLLTCELALAKGYNPDYNDALGKIATF